MKSRNYLALVSLTICLILAGCGNKEAKQREAFIDILQTKIITQKGVVTPTLTDEERRQIGPYADHFQILLDFNTTMDKRLDGLSEPMEKTKRIEVSNDPQANLDSINQIKEMIASVTTSFNEEFAKAKINKEALQQPDDLRAVFDLAFEKSLTKPVNAFNALMNQVDRFMTTQKNLYEFVLANKNKLDLTGNKILIMDNSIESELNSLMREANKEAASLNAAQAEFNKAMKE